MARRKREFTTFNLSFLDIMSCGFGAVVLVFLIMNHAIDQQTVELNEDLFSEVDLVEEDVADGVAGLVRLRNTLADVDLQIVDADGQASRIMEETNTYRAKIASLTNDDYIDPDDIADRKAELEALEDEVKRLRAASEDNTGVNARAFIGDGNRQYLTGLKLGGKHIAIFLDVSASMLAERLVQIIRLRNMDEAVQRSAGKWTRSINTIDWLTAQLPVSSNYQLFLFNTQTRYALPETQGKWLEVANQVQLQQVSDSLRTITPEGGTSLENAFLALQTLSPPADNIFLITDGLPTQGTEAPRGNTVNGATRLKLFRSAVKQLPNRVPVNIILAPMEGDPMAAAEFWHLAERTGGAFLSPSRDWP